MIRLLTTLTPEQFVVLTEDERIAYADFRQWWDGDIDFCRYAAEPVPALLATIAGLRVNNAALKAKAELGSAVEAMPEGWTLSHIPKWPKHIADDEVWIVHIMDIVFGVMLRGESGITPLEVLTKAQAKP